MEQLEATFPVPSELTMLNSPSCWSAGGRQTHSIRAFIPVRPLSSHVDVPEVVTAVHARNSPRGRWDVAVHWTPLALAWSLHHAAIRGEIFVIGAISGSTLSMDWPNCRFIGTDLRLYGIHRLSWAGGWCCGYDCGRAGRPIGCTTICNIYKL